jgi:SAM-dependent methyltransferase
MGAGLGVGRSQHAETIVGALEAGRMRDVLNLGCGRKLLDDAVNVDVSAEVGADVVHDLASIPWPLPSDTFRKVYAFDVIEHLDNIAATMGEIHRVCAAGGQVHITVPHFSSANAFTDPTHRHQLGYFSFDYFDADHPVAFYSKARFKRRKVEIVFHPSWPNKIVHRLANRWPAAYERRWAWIFPAWFLSVDLDAIK